ncbi:MAG: hypothetical protein PHV42_04025, partial [Candidatus Pacebacteria bacterium]|nr:hypothetical protein [Candidatus Paceibacterota bacterium]
YRPVMPETARAAFIAAIEFVDYVIIFHEPRVTKVISALRPGVFVKGSDRTLSTMNQEEKELILGYGGKIRFADSYREFSSTALIRQIQALPPPKVQ